MASVDVIKCCLDTIRQISDQITDAVVYLDAGSLEAFEFMGAFPLLLEIGVRAVCSLENMSPLDITSSWSSSFMDIAKKVVIITSRLLSDAHRYILRCLVSHRTILQCSIFTSISEIAHSAYIDSPLGPDAFREYESLLLQDYEEAVLQQEKKSLHQHNVNEQSEKAKDHPSLLLDSGDDYELKGEASKGKLYEEDCTTSLREDRPTRLLVSVHHFPMILCPLSPKVFVLPSEGMVAEACLSNDHEDSLSPGLPSICTGLPAEGEDTPPGMTMTAHFLYHLAAKMDLKMEIFSLGDTSRIIGKMLTDMSSLYDVGRRNKRMAGLLLIDRTLDLLTPCCHGDSFLDRIFSSLPHVDRIVSPLPIKNAQNQSKHSPLGVQRNPLGIKLNFGTILSPQLPKSITAFISGWNSEVADHVDKVQANLSNCEISLVNDPLLSNHLGTNYLEELLLLKRAKDGPVLIKDRLLEALQNDKVPLGVKGLRGSAAASELRALVKKLAPNPMFLMRNIGIIKLALAAEIALGEPYSSRWDAFVSAERILSISSEDTSQSLSGQIRDLINTSILARPSERKNGESSEVLLSLQDVLLLSMTGYLLAGENFPTSGSTGPFSFEEEHTLKEAVIDAILESPKSAEFHFLHDLGKELEANSREELLKHENAIAKPSEVEDHDDDDDDDDDDGWGTWDDEDTNFNLEQAHNKRMKVLLRDRVDHLFELFHKLSGLKWRNSTLREGSLASSINSDSDACLRKGFLYKVLTSALSKDDIPGLEYHSSGVGRFFKSGFGRFGLGQAKPSFGDQEVLLVFVVGGINGLEVREAMDAVLESSRPDLELILGGTALLVPDDMFELLLGSSSYM